ncbi:MAG TPA: peptidylprolyl isomerase [Candidatus Dormibacteraeota bacterium]|nr:peptidylprolyl isomerase [Candidatus Dormibacteraeota bacterium]
MSDRNPTPPAQRLPLALGAGAVLLGGLIVAIIFYNNANGPASTASTSTSPSASASPAASSSPSPTPSTIAFADCSTASFGTPLPPFGEPANPHVYSAAPTLQIDVTKLYEATIHTVRGTIVLCLQPALAPLTVNNFVALARNHFFDGIPFHRVCPNSADSSCGGTLAIVQGGDPNCIGNVHATTCGQGGPGYKFADEPVHQQYTAGSVAMANSGANTNGSQFFIDITAVQLPPSYNLFGKVATGLDVAGKIVQGDVMQSVTVTQQT